MVWRELLMLLTGTSSYPRNYNVLPFTSAKSEPATMFFEEHNAAQKDKHREGEDKETSAQSHPGVGQKKNKRLLTEDQLSSPFEILGRGKVRSMKGFEEEGS